MKVASSVRDIDIALLRAFVAVAETGRMSLAARVVHRSQGAVSQQIARLEALFNERLFERRPGAVRLTHDGERLLVSARRLILANDELLARMRGANFASEVRLGVPPDVVSLVPPALRSFRVRRPDVQVILVSDGTQALRRALAEGTVDLAMTTDLVAADGDGLLLSDDLIWVGAPGGDAHLRRPLPVALGQERCAFRAATVAALVKADVEWRAICQHGSLEPVFATLEADGAVGAFLSKTVPDRLAAIEPRRNLPRLPVCYINLSLSVRATSEGSLELAACLHQQLGNLGSNSWTGRA